MCSSHSNIVYAIPMEEIIPIEEVSLSELKQQFPGFVVPQSKGLLLFLESRKANNNVL